MTLPTVNRAHDYIVHASSIHGTRYTSTVRAASDPVIAHKELASTQRRSNSDHVAPAFIRWGFGSLRKIQIAEVNVSLDQGT